MEREEYAQFQLWIKVAERQMRMYDIEPLSEVFETIKKNAKMDVIITKKDGSIFLWDGLDSAKTIYNIPGQTKTYDSVYFAKQLAKMKRQHKHTLMKGINDEPLIAYYSDSNILTQLRYFPYIQMGVIALFLITAYVAFSSARKLEQDQVWAGLAKETAHQLGTPISSLMAWVELIKDKFKAENDSLIIEMENDIHRLEIITDRFSKIGSKPILKDREVYQAIQKFVNYFKIRTSEKISIQLKGNKQVRAMINVPLFDWVIENLLKNAVNAIGLEGHITINVIENYTSEEVLIDVTDTGKGIAKSKFDAIFQPGYTTKKRGWGLGLSLTKRIVENYHNGKIFVKDSDLGKGSTLRIVLKSSLTYEPATTK